MFKKINANIIDILGISTLPEEEQKNTMEKMGGIVYQEIMLRAIDLLSEEDKNQFEKIMQENPNPEAMFAFLEEKIPNIEEIANEEAEKFKADSANIMSQIG